MHLSTDETYAPPRPWQEELAFKAAERAIDEQNNTASICLVDHIHITVRLHSPLLIHASNPGFEEASGEEDSYWPMPEDELDTSNRCFDSKGAPSVGGGWWCVLCEVGSRGGCRMCECQNTVVPNPKVTLQGPRLWCRIARHWTRPWHPWQYVIQLWM